MIDRHARMPKLSYPKLSYPKLEVVRASGRALVHGIETRKIEGVKDRVTSPAKTSPRDIGASVRARLLRLARERGEDYQLDMQQPRP